MLYNVNVKVSFRFLIIINITLVNGKLTWTGLSKVWCSVKLWTIEMTADVTVAKG